MAKPHKGLKGTKKIKKRVLPKGTKTLSLTLDDIQAANDVSKSNFLTTMTKRQESAPGRYQFVKNAVEAQGINFDYEVKKQFYNATRSLFSAEKIIRITYTELKKTQFLSFVNNTGILAQKRMRSLTKVTKDFN